MDQFDPFSNTIELHGIVFLIHPEELDDRNACDDTKNVEGVEEMKKKYKLGEGSISIA